MYVPQQGFMDVQSLLLIHVPWCNQSICIGDELSLLANPGFIYNILSSWFLLWIYFFLKGKKLWQPSTCIDWFKKKRPPDKIMAFLIISLIKSEHGKEDPLERESQLAVTLSYNGRTLCCKNCLHLIHLLLTKPAVSYLLYPHILPPILLHLLLHG